MSDLDRTGKEEEKSEAKKKQLKTVGSEELEILCWITCVDLSTFQFEKGKREKEEMVVEERFSLQSRVPAVQGYCAGESTDTLTWFRNEVGKEKF